LTSNNNVYDCSLAAYLLNPIKNSYEYNNIAFDYLGITINSKKDLLGKNEINIFNYYDEAIMKYIAYSSLIPLLSQDCLDNKIKEANMYDLYYKIELPCVYILYDMEKFGIKVNKQGLIDFGNKLDENIEKLISQIYDLAGKEFNINSTKQLGEVLFEDLGLKAGKKTKTGYSTSVEVLEKLSSEHPIIPLILEYRTLTKLNSTYVAGMLPCIRDDGRIHGTFNQTVTATGRISSTEPNLQNIPTRTELGREIRRVFVPEDGYIFLDADYSQIELRVLAHFSDDETLINAYNRDSDIHAITASEVFGVPLEQVDSLMRRRAKAVNFGIVYGISSFGLGQDLDITRKEAEGYINKYFETYKGVKHYLDKAVLDAKAQGYSTTLYNRRRPIPELSSSNFMTRSFGERVAMNSPIQGTAADVIKIAMINVSNKLKSLDLKSRLILQVHDELIIETALEEKDQVKEILVDEMIKAASLRVKLEVDVNEGYSWYDAK
ncbi:MAG: DNA polymerase I, partial [Lachnospiraceae bacterium]|nr:DNA polymerase I [Lachnospiraceae bacterium]